MCALADKDKKVQVHKKLEGRKIKNASVKLAKQKTRKLDWNDYESDERAINEAKLPKPQHQHQHQIYHLNQPYHYGHLRMFVSILLMTNGMTNRMTNQTTKTKRNQLALADPDELPTIQQ